MHIYRLAVLASALLASFSSFGAQPGLTFDGSNATVTVPAGHRVAWLRLGSSYDTGLAPDSDNDGQVTITPPNGIQGQWLVADVETGEWTRHPEALTIFEPEAPLYAFSIDPDPSGAYSVFGIFDSFKTGLWLRPGIGAWAPPSLGFGGSMRLAAGPRNRLIADLSELHPVGSSPNTPPGAERGDILVMLVDNKVHANVVDSELDIEFAGSLSFDAQTKSPLEGSTVTVDVIRHGGTEGTVTASCVSSYVYVTSPPDGATAAVAGVDFEAFGPQELRFGPGEVLKQCTYKTIDDDLFSDRPRYLNIGITPPTGGAISDYWYAHQLLLIEDDDPAPVIQFGNVPESVLEGDENWTLDVPWSLSGNFRGPISLRFGTPYSSGSPIVVTPGDTQRVSSVLIQANDNTNQPTTIQMRVVPTSESSRIRSVSRHLTVLDDELAELILEDVTITEGPGSRVVIPIRFSPSPLEDVTISWAAADGSATGTDDFLAGSGTVHYRWPSGAEIEIPLRNDSAAESTETFYLDITGISGPVAPLEKTRYAITIIDDDMKPAAVTLSAAAIVEGNDWNTSAPVRVQLAGPMTSEIRMTLVPAGGTAKANWDYVPFRIPVVFTPGETEKIASITVFGETTPEPDETLVIVAESQWGDLASTTLVIEDDDTAASLSIAGATVVEPTGTSTSAEFRITFSEPPAAPGSVQYESIDGTAKAGSDYEAASGTLQFPAGASEMWIPVEVFGDALTEQDETFRIQLSKPSAGLVLSGDEATATIYDDDVPVERPIVSIADIEVRETDDAREAVFELRLSKASNETVTLSFETRDGTASAPSDYEHRAGTVAFAPRQTRQTVAITIVGDDTNEETETFRIRLSDSKGAITPDAEAVCTVVDDDEKRSRRRSARH